jgi:pimeloyl-ACP methyl ester carboxylesterase
MKKKCFTIKVNGVNFYCEMRGRGPTLVFVPDGCNDCEPFDKVSDSLADDFTVLSFDMRGSVRSTIIGEPTPVTPRMLAGDVAGIINELSLGPASIYGCSSGGQAVLAVGKYFPGVARNLLVHEAALQSDTPIPHTGFEFFKSLAQFEPYCDGFTPMQVAMVGSLEKWRALGPDCLKRIAQNSLFWATYYLGTVDRDTYSADDLAKMPNVEFSVGTWTPSFLVYANIETAKRAGKSVTWLPCAHYPQVVCPEELADYVRRTCNRYS